MQATLEAPETVLERPENWAAADRLEQEAPGERPSPWRQHRLTRVDVVLSFALAATALLARLPFIVRGETLLHSDEAIVGLMAQDIAEGTRFPVYFYGQRYMGALEAYVIAAIRPFCDDPIISLRLGPCLFLAALVAIEFLLLTRWFGRRGGLIGALTLVAAAPMFVQWSISARGGYIEILLWGALLWWAYSDWFVPPCPDTHRQFRRAVFGLLVGSGLWINPTIVVFIAPIILHASLANRSKLAPAGSRIDVGLRRLDELLRGYPLALPLLGLVALLAINCLWSVKIDSGQVQHVILFGLLSRRVSAGIFIALMIAAATWLARQPGIIASCRKRANESAPFLIGMLIGNAPAAWYVVQRSIAGTPLEDTLPLGIRPLWRIGETIHYLIRGTPVVLGADPKPFVELVCVGRSFSIAPLAESLAALLVATSWAVAAALLVAGWCLVQACGREFGSLLRLMCGPHSPAAFLMLAFSCLLALYITSGCTVDFTSIRYLVPLWVILPGLLAAVVSVDRFRRRAMVCSLTLFAAWTVGQVAFYSQLGSPHPLTRLGKTLKDRDVRVALAEPLDAHLLSFITQQESRIGEFQSFWPRLASYRENLNASAPTAYIVHASDTDWTRDWARPGWPGPAPPETSRFLWPMLKSTLAESPEEILERHTLTDGYELWLLAHPLPERKPGENPAGT